jgi:hypothetical protein
MNSLPRASHEPAAIAYQLVLTDRTLRVLFVASPDGAVSRELARARDPMDGGHLSANQVRRLAAVLDERCVLVTAGAQATARRELACALTRLDIDALSVQERNVSIFLWDSDRDGESTTAEAPDDNRLPAASDLTSDAAHEQPSPLADHPACDQSSGSGHPLQGSRSRSRTE